MLFYLKKVLKSTINTKNSTNLKTWFNSLNDVQKAVNSISSFSTLANGATNLFSDSAVVQQYASALNGLNKEQALLTLSYKNLSVQQKEQILSQMGLIASENTIQSELLQTTLTQKGLSAEKSKAILVELELMNGETSELLTQKACTKANLEATLALHGITGAQAEAIVSALGLSGANADLTVSFGLLTKSILSTIAALLSNPVTWVIAGIVGLVAVVDIATTSTKEYEEQLKELENEYTEFTSEIKSVESELQRISDRMEELEGKEAPSFTEKEEYENLVKENNELERKLDLLELEEKKKKEQLNNGFVNAMNSDMTDKAKYALTDGYGSYIADSNGNFIYGSEKEYIEQQFANLEKLKQEQYEAQTLKEKEEIQKYIDNIEQYLSDKNIDFSSKSENIEYIKEPTSEDDKAVNEWLDYIADFQDKMAILTSKGDPSSNAKYKTNAFNRLIDNWKFDDVVQGLQDLGKEGKVTAEMLNDPKYDEFIDKLVFLGIIDSASNLEDIALAFNSISSSAEKASNAISEYNPSQFTTTLSEIQDLSKGLDQLDSIMADVIDGESFDWSSILNNDDFKEAFEDCDDAYDNFIKTISESPDDLAKCKSAFNDLATQYIYNSSALENLTEDTKDAVAIMLREMGVINANEIVDAYLNVANAKREIANLGYDFANITSAECIELIRLGLVSQDTQQYLFYYQLQKALSNENPLSTENDIQQLISLAKNAGVTGDVINDLNELMRLHSEIALATQNQDKDTVTVLTSRAETLLESIKTQASSMNETYEPVVKYGNGVKSAAAAQKKLEDSTKKATEALESQKSALEKQKQKYDDIISAINWFYDKKIDKEQKSIDKLEKENELIQDQIDIYDGALSAIDRYYEKQQQALQDKIDAMDDANSEKEREIALEEALQKLQEARSRKSLLLYQKGKGVTYVQDQTAIKEAEENLANAQQEKVKADLQAEIEKLQKYRDLWAEIPNIKQEAEQQSQMVELLGANWESILLEGRIENLTTFKDRYVGLQQQIDDNTSLIESHNQKIEYYESLKSQWDDLTNKYQEDTYIQLLISAFGNDYENELLNGRTDRWTQFADDYYNIQVQLKDVTDQIETLAERMESYANQIESSANDAINAVKKLKEVEKELGGTKITSFSPGGGKYVASAKAKGGIITKEDGGDLDFVAKKLGEDHMIAIQEGEAVIPKESVAKNPELVDALLDKDALNRLCKGQEVINLSDLNLNLANIRFDNPGIQSLSKEIYSVPKFFEQMNNKPMMNVSKNNSVTELHFNGDLSFPNIRSSVEAEKLIQELSTLSSKALQRANKRI